VDTLRAEREKKIAALASVGTALVLVSLKIFLSVATGSLGILSEALHSGLDLIAAIITYLSVRVSLKPADADHTYGHGKVESFSAFVETALLLITALYVIWEAFHRLITQEVHIKPSWLAIGIFGLMAVMDVVRSRALDRVARKYESEALEADALHFSTDVWSTLVVMFGIVCAWLGQRFGWEGLYYADPIAALFVAGVIIWVGSRLGKRTLDALLDAAPLGLQQHIAAAVGGLPGVLATERVRVRRAGNRYFADVTVSVPRAHTFEQVHEISEAVERRVAEIIPADVVVHTKPRAHAGENFFDEIRAIARRRGLAIHELSAQLLNQKLFIEMHLEVDEHLGLREAHRLATELEREIRLLPSVGPASEGLAEINIHIEPLGAHIPTAEELHGLSESVQDYVNSLRGDYPELGDCHEVHVRSTEGKIVVSCHCVLDGGLPITQVHDVTQAVEDRIKERFPRIYQVTIHSEPPEER
jgi:cation diffusion facilitator family transporter